MKWLKITKYFLLASDVVTYYVSNKRQETVQANSIKQKLNRSSSTQKLLEQSIIVYQHVPATSTLQLILKRCLSCFLSFIQHKKNLSLHVPSSCKITQALFGIVEVLLKKKG
jgi:hypothetical protein